MIGQGQYLIDLSVNPDDLAAFAAEIQRRAPQWQR